MSIEIEIDEKRIDHEQMEFFLKGNVSLEKSNESKIKAKTSWLTDEMWRRCVDLSERFPHRFGSLTRELLTNSIDWRRWIEEENEILPKPFNKH